MGLGRNCHVPHRRSDRRIGGNYHFVSDIIGGAYLGVGLGLAIVALMVQPNRDRLK